MLADVFGDRAGVDWEPIAPSDCPWPACLYAVLDYDEKQDKEVVIGCRMTSLTGFNCPQKPAKLAKFSEIASRPSKAPVVLNIMPNVNVTIKTSSGQMCVEDYFQIHEAVHDGVYKGLDELFKDLGNALAKDGAH